MPIEGGRSSCPPEVQKGGNAGARKGNRSSCSGDMYRQLLHRKEWNRLAVRLSRAAGLSLSSCSGSQSRIAGPDAAEAATRMATAMATAADDGDSEDGWDAAAATVRQVAGGIRTDQLSIFRLPASRDVFSGYKIYVRGLAAAALVG